MNNQFKEEVGKVQADKYLVEELGKEIKSGFFLHYGLEHGVSPEDRKEELKESIKTKSQEYSSVPEIKRSELLMEHIKGAHFGGSDKDIADVLPEFEEASENIDKRLISAKMDYLKEMGSHHKNEVVLDSFIPLTNSPFDKEGYVVDELTSGDVQSYVIELNRIAGTSENHFMTYLKLDEEGDLEKSKFGVAFSKEGLKKEGVDVNNVIKEAYDNSFDFPHSESGMPVPSSLEDGEEENLKVYERVVGGNYAGVTASEWSSVSTKEKDNVYNAFDEESPVKSKNKQMLSMKL